MLIKPLQLVNNDNNIQLSKWNCKYSYFTAKVASQNYQRMFLENMNMEIEKDLS